MEAVPGLSLHGLARTFCWRGRFAWIELPRLRAVKWIGNTVPTLESLQELGRVLFDCTAQEVRAAMQTHCPLDLLNAETLARLRC